MVPRHPQDTLTVGLRNSRLPAANDLHRPEVYHARHQAVLRAPLSVHHRQPPRPLVPFFPVARIGTKPLLKSPLLAINTQTDTFPPLYDSQKLQGSPGYALHVGTSTGLAGLCAILMAVRKSDPKASLNYMRNTSLPAACQSCRSGALRLLLGLLLPHDHLWEHSAHLPIVETRLLTDVLMFDKLPLILADAVVIGGRLSTRRRTRRAHPRGPRWKLRALGVHHTFGHRPDLRL